MTDWSLPKLVMALSYRVNLEELQEREETLAQQQFFGFQPPPT